MAARILDKSFVYVPSGKTDVAATFARIRKEMENARKGGEETAHNCADNDTHRSADAVVSIVGAYKNRRTRQ